MEEYRMIAPGMTVVAGVSGGADSVCLLLLLLAFREKVPFNPAVVHVNHGIRECAAEDARYVEEMCSEYGIPFFLTESNVRETARKERCSEEDAGRRIRYRAFAGASESLGGGRIAVAHTADDNAETMLFHLFRGSGIKGLTGIAPVREDTLCRDGIIRPILCLKRREVEEYLTACGRAWCSDYTNDGDDYGRNRIRHHILPYAEREIAAGAVGHMCRTAELLRETEDYLTEQTRDALRKCAVGRTRAVILDVNAFNAFHEVLRKRMLMTLLNGLSPSGKDISFIHVRDTLKLFAEEGNGSVSLPFGIIAYRQYGRVTLERKDAAAAEGTGQSMPPEPVSVALTEELFRTPLIIEAGGGKRLEFSAFLIKKGQEVPENRYTKWFDYDKIKESLAVRPRRPGDFLTIAGSAGEMRHKSLKDYMITEKIPRQIRDAIPLLTEGSHVLWLPGRRISEYFKTDGNTERILQVKFLWEENTKNRAGGGTEEKDV